MSGSPTEQTPLSWAIAKLRDIAVVVMGQSPSSSTYNLDGKGLPFFQGKADFGFLYPTIRVWCSRPNKIAEPDDVLLCVRAPVGPTNLAATESCIGRGLAAVRPEAGVNLRYLLHAFRTFAGELDAKGTGTTFKAISGKVVRDFSFPIAPAAEQQRIAYVLD
ncbi:MAG: restriction endonuclease subunit S, partial [Pyrinomonadaceae bacterium]